MKYFNLSLALFTFVNIFALSSASADVTLSVLIGDNMVLQQDAKVPIWGKAASGENVTVEFLGQTHVVTTSKNGSWEIRLNPLKAGGPYTMTIRGRNTIILKNILVGEVWVASGQSNMDMFVIGCLNGDKEISAAKYPRIHLFNVDHTPAIAPTKDLMKTPGWSECSPASVPYFSAAAYFFGRKLHKDLNVPIGLINSSWGGSNAETWTPAQAFNTHPSLRPIYQQLILNPSKSREGGRKAYVKVLHDWEVTTHRNDPGNKGVELGWAKTDFDAIGWKTVQVPGVWENYGPDWEQLDGVVWFRKNVEIPASWSGKNLYLDLGVLDDFDTTYFNGKQVGAIGSETPAYWAAVRKYVVPGALVKAGKNVIAVRIFDHFMDGGFKGGNLTLGPVAGGKPISLAGPWPAKIEHKSQPIYPEYRKPVDNGIPGDYNTPTALYNGMIFPVIPYAIRGVIWYQGESNAGQGESYSVLLTALIEGWRNAWGQGDFPFLVVQLANFLARQPQPTDDAWAHLRAGQAKAVREVKNSGLVVTIDVGDAADIHPKNKQAVGHRLALAAEYITYGWKIPYSGPVYRSMTQEGNRIRVKFDHTDGGLVVKGNKLEGFAVAGETKKFVWAQARVEGDTVVVWADAVPKPVAVRYAWAYNPAATLYNAADLPAVPFRTDGW
jgi:sialate O-acetylesterase